MIDRPGAPGIGIDAAPAVDPDGVPRIALPQAPHDFGELGGARITVDSNPICAVSLDNTACGLMFQAFLPAETISKARRLQPPHFRGALAGSDRLADIRQALWAEMTSYLLSGVTGQAAPVFDAQDELVCVMTTVTDLGQLRRPEDRNALFATANAANRERSGLGLNPGT